jgi:hypothetical protein
MEYALRSPEIERSRLVARELNLNGKGEDALAALAGKANAADRRSAYRQWAPRFKKFFDCLKGNPLWGRH